MIPTAAFENLNQHLDLEADHLVCLLRLLEEEARALRRLDGVRLGDLARERAAVVESHQHLTRERGARLSDCAPAVGADRLSALWPVADDAQRASLAERRDRLADLVRGVQERQRMNEAYAATGQETISRALDRLRRTRAGGELVYGANGRIAPRGQSLLRKLG